MKFSHEQINQLISELPDNIRTVVEGFDWAGEVMKIGQAHNLQIDDIEIFHDETLLVVLGKTPATEYENSLMRSMNIDKELADTLVDFANEHIFSVLQKLAFTKTKPEEETEGVEHNELVDEMRSEGIELVHHSTEPVIPSKLGDEITSILSPELNDSTSIETPEPSTTENTDQEPPTIIYNEPINLDDTVGIGKHRTNTDILKTNNQNTPEDVFNLDDADLMSTSKNSLQDEVTASLPETLRAETFVSKGDTVDTSPTETALAEEVGGFLEQLKEGVTS